VQHCKAIFPQLKINFKKFIELAYTISQCGEHRNVVKYRGQQREVCQSLLGDITIDIEE